MKNFFLIIGAIILLVSATWFFFSSDGSSNSDDSLNGQDTSLPVAGPAGQVGVTPSSSISEAALVIATVDGETVKTKDFIQDPATVEDPINTGYYYLGYHTYEGVPDQTATDNPPYTITYIHATQYFNIALLQEPIGLARKEAERYFLAHLGLPQEQACRLNYMVSVPDRVNSQFAGIDLGFSFCPGATILPQ